MEILEIFSVLGIEPTKDTDAVRQAYREKLRSTNPEENPEGFKRLRRAYEEACAYAARTEDEDGAQDERDETPSGLWAERAGEIYGRLDTRMDPQQWRKLLEDDLLLSLEEEENCRVKLLVFLMDHFRLPTAVWKLLDEKLNLVRDAGRLKESFRADFISYVVSKCVYGEDIVFEQFEGAPDAPYDLFLRYYDECWRALREKRKDTAAETMAAADRLGIRHPAMEIIRGYLLLLQEKKEEAKPLLERLLETYPEDIMVAFNAAEILWRMDEKEEAAGIFEKLKARNRRHYMANYRLAEWYFSRGEYRLSKKCAEDAGREGDDGTLRDMLVRANGMIEEELENDWEKRRDWESGFTLAKCWLQDGRVCRAFRLAGELEKLKEYQPEKSRTEYTGLMTLLYAEWAEYEDAIYMAGIWEKALEEELAGAEDEEAEEDAADRIRQARMVRIRCCHYLGYKDRLYFERAIAEITAMETGTSKDVLPLLEKARIYLDMKEYEKCREVAEQLIEEYQTEAANIAAMEAWSREWDAGGVLHCAKRCMEEYPDYARAYESAANVYLALGYRKELQEILAEADANHVESVVLDAYRYQMDHQIPDMETMKKKLDEFRENYTDRVEKGEMAYYEKGLPILTEYLYWRPEAYMLRERALFHRAGQHYKEALADFEKAMESDPSSPYTFRGMALTYLYMGDYESALIYLKRAILILEEKWPVIYTELALIYLRLGAYERALEAYRRYEQAVRKEKQQGYQIRRMAQAMAGCGQYQEAYAKLNAYYLDTGHAGGRELLERYEDLTDLCQATGQKDKAEELLAEWRVKLKHLHGMPGMSGNFLIGLFGRGTADKTKESERNSAEYCCAMGWQELMYGSGKKAVRWLERMRSARKRDRRANGEEPEDDDERAGLCDLVFACILTGNSAAGKRHAKALRACREKEKAKPHDAYFKARKARQWTDFLADYYFEEEGALRTLIDREDETCRYCICCQCKEIEAGRVLLLLRQGKREEAEERLQRNLKKMPQDEFAMAIQHIWEKKALS